VCLIPLEAEIRHVHQVLIRYFDDTGCLVTQSHRHRPRPVSVDDGEIGMAKAGSRDLDEHLVSAGRRELVSGLVFAYGVVMPIALSTAARIFMISPCSGGPAKSSHPLTVASIAKEITDPHALKKSYAFGRKLPCLVNASLPPPNAPPYWTSPRRCARGGRIRRFCS
jgi:hypothetical protein